MFKSVTNVEEARLLFDAGLLHWRNHDNSLTTVSAAWFDLPITEQFIRCVTEDDKVGIQIEE